jgi:hypothetical protein
MCVRRGTTSIRQQKWSAPREAAERVVQEGGAGRAVVVEACPGAPWREHELVGKARAVGDHQHGLVVDRDDALVELDLLLDEVLEQVPAHRPLRVGAEALALARDGGGDEVERVDLRVGVGQRGAGLAALVDDHVDVGGVRGVCAHALAPDADGGAHLVDLELGERVDRLRRVDDDLVAAPRRRGREQVALGERRRRLALLVERRVEVRHDAHGPARRVRAVAVRAQREHLGRRAVLVALEEGVGLGVDRRARLGAQAAARARGALGGDDRLQAGQRVDADLGHGATE